MAFPAIRPLRGGIFLHAAMGYTTLISVIVADDHNAMRAQVSDVLAENFDLLASVDNGKELLDAEAEHHPDIVVSDISMPGLNGFEVARHLRSSGTNAKIVLLTVHSDRTFAEEAFSLGVSGYVVKSRLASDLVPAIEEATRGINFVSPGVLSDD